MRVIIAGSRGITDFSLVQEAITESCFEITEVVSGHARGVDALGEAWALKHGVKLKVFPANWDKYGPRAGPIRNGEMAEYAEALIALWDGKSSGTESMIEKAQAKGLKVYVKVVPSELIG